MELLELALLFLGGSIERKKGWEFHLRRPGADHHAWLMSKCICPKNLSREALLNRKRVVLQGVVLSTPTV